MALELKESTEKGLTIVEVSGELDSSSVTSFFIGFKEIAEKNKSRGYIVDMHRLDFISSAGWTAFLNLFNFLKESGKELKLARLQPEAKRVYGLIGIDGVIKSFETIKEAVESYAE